MRSWSFSGWAWAPSEAPFRVGYVAPSTWVMKYPLGRLVITATCSPGLPIVVRFLVRSSVRPAAAPESTWIAASRRGAPPAPVGAGSGSALGGGAGGGAAGLGGAVVSAAAGAG